MSDINFIYDQTVCWWMSHTNGWRHSGVRAANGAMAIGWGKGWRVAKQWIIVLLHAEMGKDMLLLIHRSMPLPVDLLSFCMLLYTIYDLVSSLRYMIFIFLRHFVISLITVLVIIIIICDWTVRPKPVAHGVVAYREPLQKWNYHIIWVH
jgi:hypothetical protein